MTARWSERCIAAGAGRRSQGVALIIVLWILVLLAIVTGGFAVLARTENLQARHLLDTTRAHFAAEAGLHRAVWELRNPDQSTRWVADGRSYEFDWDAKKDGGDPIKVEVEIVDESGKIDINVADENTLRNLLASVGVEEIAANEIADAILDWRDPDDLVRLYGAEDNDYESADYPYLSKDAPFDTVPELQQVMGIDYELYQKLEPAITVYSGRADPNMAFAQREVLLTLPDLTPEDVDLFIEQRELSDPNGDPLLLPDGTPLLARGGGLTYSIRSRATLPNGAWTVLDATLRLGGGPQGRPFRIVRWRDNVTERESGAGAGNESGGPADENSIEQEG